MKKYIPVILAACLLASCLKEGESFCSGYIVLTFTHDGNKEDFDRVIGNDVYLHIYNDDILVDNKILAYSEIADGGEYLISKEHTGLIDIVAWAVPPAGDKTLIPECVARESKSGKRLKMKNITRALEVEAMNDLFLGSVSFVDDNPVAESRHSVSMSTCICKVSVTVASDAGYYQPGQIETPRIEIYGTMSEMDLDFTGTGEQAIVPSDLIYNGERYITGELGLLPSNASQYLSVTGFSGNKALFTVDTQYRSVPGDWIEIYVDNKSSVVVTVNGWRVFSTITDL